MNNQTATIQTMNAAAVLSYYKMLVSISHMIARTGKNRAAFKANMAATIERAKKLGVNL